MTGSGGDRTDVAGDFNSDDETARILDYWTEERMREAQPIELPSAPTDPRSTRADDEAQPDASAGGPIVELPSGEASAQGQQTNPFHPDQNSRPWWNCGKLFFTTNAGNYTGSASFVGNNRILLTAAHCIADSQTQELYRNFLFYRAYDWNGWTQQGQRVTIYCQYIWTNWFGSDPYPWDYGFMKTNEVSGAGYLGLALSAPYQDVTAVGYPSNYGNTMQMYAAAGRITSRPPGLVEMNGNLMGHGCSGGPWIAKVNPNYDPQSNIATGLNSFKYNQASDLMYGPLFTQSTLDLYNWVLSR